MFSKLCSYIAEIPALAGLEIFLGQESEPVMNLVVLEQRYGKVKIIAREYDISGITTLSTLIPQQTPLVLSLNGSAVIHRVVDEHTPSKANPDGVSPLVEWDKGDFVVQQLTMGDIHIHSLIRKPQYVSLLQSLQDLGMPILSIGLGPFALLSFLDELEVDFGKPVSIGRHEFNFHERQLTAYRLMAERQISGKISFGGEVINEKLFPAFALSVAAMAGMPIPMVSKAETALKIAEYKNKLTFRRIATVFAVFFLMVLMVNTGFYLYYNEKLAGSDGVDSNSVLQEISALKTQLDVRDRLLVSLGIEGQGLLPDMAYMADQLAATVPLSVTLRSMAFYPQDASRSSRERKPVLTASSIRIEGVCDELQQVSEWVKRLRLLEFCHHTSIDRYVYDARNDEGLFTLTFTIDGNE